MADSLRQLLTSGIADLGLTLTSGQIDAMMSYQALMARWNKAYNLTAVRDPESMVVKHLLDSLAIVPWIDGHRVIDVGTGAGLPGIPLAIASPDRSIALLDSNGKKTRFLFQVKSQLGLSNVDIIEARVERYWPVLRYDTVVSRAFASLDKMVEQCSHLLTDGGVFQAMKSSSVADELALLDTDQEVVACRDLVVPHLHEPRVLVTLRKRAATGDD